MLNSNFVIIGTLIGAVGSFAYLIDTVKGKVHPAPKSVKPDFGAGEFRGMVTLQPPSGVKIFYIFPLLSWRERV